MSNPPKGPPLLPLLVIGGVALVALGGYVGFILSSYTVGSLEQHGQLGDSIAPVTALLSLGALLIALHSMGLQRQEMADNRAVMEDQARHAEAAAKAQRRLVASQKRLAIEQKEANRLAWFADLSQRRANLASLVGAITTLRVAHTDAVVKASTKDLLDYLEQRIREEEHRIVFLERRNGLNQKGAPLEGFPERSSGVVNT